MKFAQMRVSGADLGAKDIQASSDDIVRLKHLPPPPTLKPCGEEKATVPQHTGLAWGMDRGDKPEPDGLAPGSWRALYDAGGAACPNPTDA